jgi:hypothetical protein
VRTACSDAKRGVSPQRELSCFVPCRLGCVGVTDAKHNGDKAALFADLDADGDMSISAEEMAKMESHMEDMAKAQPGGLWNVRSAVLSTPAVAPSFLPVRAAVHLNLTESTL